MHNVLSIDASSEPALAVLVGLESGTARILAKEPLQLPDSLRQFFCGSSEPPRAQDATCSSFVEVVSRYRDRATTSALIVPPVDYVSLCLDLPFTDQRTVARILPMEVQDQVPFELSEFILHPRRLGPWPSAGSNQIHVGLMPRTGIAGLLEICHEAGIEPMVFCTPASCLGAALHLSDKLASQQGLTLLVYRRGRFCNLMLSRDGLPAAERIIDLLALPQASRESELCSQILMSALTFEQEMEQQLDRVCLLSNGIDAASLAEKLALPLETVAAADILGPCSEDEFLPVLGAAFAAPLDCPAPLSDFRCGEFAYRLEFRELLKGLLRLSPWFAAFILSFALLLGLTYWVRQRELSSVRRQISQEVTTLAPSLKAAEGSEISALAAEADQISRQLSELGSDSRLTPLRIFAELSQNLDITRDSGIFIKSVSIKGHRISIQGDAPDYAALDRIESNLKKAKPKSSKPGKRIRNLFCEVKRSDSTASFSGGARAFSYSMKICDHDGGEAEGDE